MSKELLLRHWENKFETIASNEFKFNLPSPCDQSLQGLRSKSTRAKQKAMNNIYFRKLFIQIEKNYYKRNIS